MGGVCLCVCVCVYVCACRLPACPVVMNQAADWWQAGCVHYHCSLHQHIDRCCSPPASSLQWPNGPSGLRHCGPLCNYARWLVGHRLGFRPPAKLMHKLTALGLAQTVCMHRRTASKVSCQMSLLPQKLVVLPEREREGEKNNSAEGQKLFRNKKPWLCVHVRVSLERVIFCLAECTSHGCFLCPPACEVI